jgi:hypothetical protein
VALLESAKQLEESPYLEARLKKKEKELKQVEQKWALDHRSYNESQESWHEERKTILDQWSKMGFRGWKGTIRYTAAVLCRT